MRLELKTLTLTEKLNEFDFWITSKLSEIKDSEKFKSEINQIINAIEILGTRTSQFENIEDVSPDKISESIIYHVKGKPNIEQENAILGLISFIFMVTGKSDNNCKCQFPVYLHQQLNKESIPKINTKSGIEYISIPRTINDSRVAKIVASLDGYPLEQYNFLSSYIHFLLEEKSYIDSLWSLGRTYFQLKGIGYQEAFLLPLVVYRVRGSVSASGGHEPEEILRDRMKEWGLQREIDFNSNDVIVGEVDKKSKTRAYDFVLPYNIESWDQKLFIQSQFYAGDSGSVSHKNVDQISTSRAHVKTKIKEPIFLEYVDGAGYYSSLNGDLKKILAMNDTENFFQVKTSVVKLRYYLQEIGFVTPMEIFHGILLGYTNIDDCKEFLKKQGYLDSEIDRCINNAISRKLILTDSLKLSIAPKNIDIATKYLLLDLIVNQSQKMSKRDKGCLFIPGKGNLMGISLADLGNVIQKYTSEIWKESYSLLKDIQFLIDRGFVIST